jgi:hypothetical protein
MVERIKRIPLWGTYALLCYMPLHIFLAHSLSLITGGLETWKVAKDVFIMLLLAISLLLVWQLRAYKKSPYFLIVGLAAAYLLLHIGLYYHRQDTSFGVAALATVYNNRSFWLLGIGLGAALILGKKLNTHDVIKIVLAVSTLVCLLGILQYFLPKDFLTHLGYSLERGVRPAFFIDDKPDLPRIMSTLRDPNSLGGYLVIPILLLVQKLISGAKRNRMLVTGLLLLHILALSLTFSRSAGLALGISLMALGVIAYKDALHSLVRKYWKLGLIIFLIGLIGLYAARDQYFIQHVIFHADENTAAELDSNDLHIGLAQQGAKGIIDVPLGHGPGTAGIVSIQNRDGGLLTENYFVQIGYEVGALGLAIFLGMLSVVYIKISKGRLTQLHKVVLASFWGYAVMAMLTHLWTNEAITTQWWLLAGLVLGHGVLQEAVISSRPNLSNDRSHAHSAKDTKKVKPTKA